MDFIIDTGRKQILSPLDQSDDQQGQFILDIFPTNHIVQTLCNNVIVVNGSYGARSKKKLQQ